MKYQRSVGCHGRLGLTACAFVLLGAMADSLLKGDGTINDVAPAMLAFSFGGTDDGFTLDFEGLGDGDPVLEFYSGGTSGQGFSGTDHGVSFSKPARGLISGNFDNEPSPITIVYFPAGRGFTMNVEEGFTDSFAAWYVSDVPGSVEVFDGLDGTGVLLTSVGPPTSDFDGGFDDWSFIQTPFDGAARSVRLQGAENHIAFDDMTFGEPAACPADLDDDGFVGTEDLVAVLTAWGNKGGPEDLDGSGVVDIGDILAVLTAWGPCE